MSGTAEANAYENRGASKDAIQSHYDAGNGFFERLLGPTMGYSAALWKEPANLDNYDDAQNRKLDWHIDWSGADTAGRVLEVGCGWGSLARRLHARNPQAEYTGLTISGAQASYLREHFGDRVDIKTTPWQSFNANRPFQSIVNIEAIEHFARFDVSDVERIQAYREFFEFCARHLKPGGRLSLQMTTWHNVDKGREREFEADFIKRFFPETCLPRLPELVTAADGLFHIVRLETAPRDYIYTMRAWLRALRKNEADLTREFGGDLVRRNIEYFAVNLNGYLSGAMTLVRMALERRGPHIAWDPNRRPIVA